jgi:hypothetical protein
LFCSACAPPITTPAPPEICEEGQAIAVSICSDEYLLCSDSRLVSKWCDAGYVFNSDPSNQGCQSANVVPGLCCITLCVYLFYLQVVMFHRHHTMKKHSHNTVTMSNTQMAMNNISQATITIQTMLFLLDRASMV